MSDDSAEAEMKPAQGSACGRGFGEASARAIEEVKRFYVTVGYPSV